MPLNFNIGSASVPASLEVDESTDGDVFGALEANTAFPDRDITIGRITAKLSVPQVTFNPGAGASVSMQAASSFTSGLAVFQNPQGVLNSLPLDPAVTLDFQTGRTTI
jgi:hypothetical protein